MKPRHNRLIVHVLIGALALLAGAPDASYAADDGPAARIQALVDKGEITHAAQVAHEWAADEPGDLAALQAAATLGMRAGNYRSAEDALRSLTFFQPMVPELIVMLGDVLAQQGRYGAAREQYQAAIHLDDSFAPAFTGLARMERFTSDVLANVLSAAEVAMSVGAETPGALTALGAAQAEAGRYTEAVDLFARALEAEPGYAMAWYEMGLAHARSGDMEKAREAWGRYVQLEPDTGQAWRLRNDLTVVGQTLINDRSYYAAYSPDGSQIAYRARGNGGWGIYVTPTDDLTKETLLWATESNLQSLAWSPDGTELLVRLHVQVEVEVKGAKQMQWTYRLQVIPAKEGAQPRHILDDRWLGEPCWVPATGKICARMYVRRVGYVLQMIDPETGEVETIAGTKPSQPHYTPRWTRDGATVAFTRRSEMLPDGSYAYQLLAGPGDAPAKARVIHEMAEMPRSPRFTPDGSIVLFTRTLEADSARYATWAVPTDGSREPCMVDHRSGASTPPEVSPDGAFLLGGRDYGLYQLHLTGLHGGE